MFSSTNLWLDPHENTAMLTHPTSEKWGLERAAHEIISTGQ
jgi:hypothetical protein